MSAILKSKLFWAVAIPLLLLGLYALLGFQLAPKILRDQAVGFVREHYGRELAIGEVRIHPFKLQLEVRDLALPDADGQTMLGFEQLFVDFEIASIWERAFVFKSVEIGAPTLRAVIRDDGSMNLADLALPEDPDEPESAPPALWLKNLSVERGQIAFIDNARRTPFERLFEPVGFELEDFRTTPEGGEFRLSARSQTDETLEWQGNFALAPTVSSQGDFKLTRLEATGIAEYLGDALPFGLTSGLIDLEGSYRLALDEPLTVDLQLPSITLTGLGLRAAGADADWVTISAVAVTGTALSLPAQSVSIDRVAVSGLEATAWMAADGSINLQQLFDPAAAATEPALAASSPSAATTTPVTPVAATAAAGESAEPRAATEAGGETEWTVEVARVDVDAAAIDFEDRMADGPAKAFRIAPLNLRLEKASLDLASPLPLTLDAIINEHASFTASGTVTPDPLAADLDITLAKARMQILQPYVLPVADLTITRGELGVDGKLRLVPPGGDAAEIEFQGGVTVSDFRSVDNALREPLVDFRRLQLLKLQYRMAPDSMIIDQVLVDQPYARVIISADQVLNIAAVLDPAGTASALAERRAEAEAEAARTPAERRERERQARADEKAAASARKSEALPAETAKAAASPATDTFPVRVREVRVNDGRMNFSDFFIQPNFSAEVQALSGTVTGLSSAVDANATVDFAGKLDEFSPVSISGELQPFDFERYTNVDMRFENISLPIFNPYSGPIAGYNIAKGKLTTDLSYLIENRQLDAQHKIRIDQLEWGEASDTQGEATLPVKFATSLLKDRDGVITLDVPVGGTIDDPTFRIGPIVWQIIRNIIVKAVTAPFALLGALFEGAEEAQFVDFAPGDATLDATVSERLAALAKSLAEKPQLRLDVPIGAVAELDGPALAERAFESALAAGTADAGGAKRSGDGAAAPEFSSLEHKQKVAVLASIIRTQSGAEPVVPEPAAPPEGTSRADARAMREAAEIEYLTATARAGVVVPETELDRLAQERAAAIERALLVGGTIEPSRVFQIRDGKVGTEGGKVRFELGLQ